MYHYTYKNAEETKNGAGTLIIIYFQNYDFINYLSTCSVAYQNWGFSNDTQIMILT